MLKNPYRYIVELYGYDAAPLGRFAMNVDWEPAREWTRFAAVRSERLAPGAIDRIAAVEPIWHPDAGEPYIDGFDVTLTADGAAEVTSRFATDYFSRLALSAASRCVERGKIAAGERVRYVMTALPAPESPGAPRGAAFTVEEVAPDLPLVDSSLAEFAARAGIAGDMHQEDLPVFLPRHVFEEATTLTREAGPRETGGILIGHVRRDAGVPELFVEVTAQVRARHTQADLTSLTFTPETWTDVRAAIDLRARGEIMVGWWHSHPVREWCKSCSHENRVSCSLAAGFLSAHDRALHRAVFPRAYSHALVVNDIDAALPTFSLFGWRRGTLESRGYGVIDGLAEAPELELARSAV